MKMTDDVMVNPNLITDGFVPRGRQCSLATLTGLRGLSLSYLFLGILG